MPTYLRFGIMVVSHSHPSGLALVAGVLVCWGLLFVAGNLKAFYPPLPIHIAFIPLPKHFIQTCVRSLLFALLGCFLLPIRACWIVLLWHIWHSWVPCLIFGASLGSSARLGALSRCQFWLALLGVLTNVAKFWLALLGALTNVANFWLALLGALNDVAKFWLRTLGCLI